MIDTLYIERGIREHPRTRDIVARFPSAHVVDCDHYGEVFNRAGQSFRLQKQRPALVLAAKTGRRVLAAPAGYAVGGSRNYYFSHMLNCLYDCRYCFLQGAYRSAHYLLFVNYEDFRDDIAALAAADAAGRPWFFSGYDCDSLALEPVTRFAETFLPWFETMPSARLELRTKSTQVRGLLARAPLPNVVVAFSFTTAPAAERLEHRVPDADRRIEAMVRLQEAGWTLALRFDPLVWHRDQAAHFEALCARIFARVDGGRLHSTCLGAFRMPRDYFKRLRRLYPLEPAFAGGLVDQQGMVAYDPKIESGMIEAATGCLSRFVPVSTIHRMQE